MPQKALVNTKWTRSCPPPPRHPIILLKSNLFNMATISVKKSIGFKMKKINK